MVVMSQLVRSFPAIEYHESKTPGFVNIDKLEME